MWRGFLQMRTDIDRAVEAQLREHGLSFADYGVLVVLSEAPDRTLRVGEIAERTHWESSRLAHHLRRMEQRRLVRRFSCNHDGRGTWVALTDGGRSAIERAAPGHAETVRRAFVDLVDPDNLEVIITLAARVRAAVDGSAGSGAPSPGASPAVASGTT